jgi:hypothetical protein
MHCPLVHSALGLLLAIILLGCGDDESDASATTGSPAVTCSSQASGASGNSCHADLSSCSDGHTYSLLCRDTGCFCVLDGVETPAADVDTCPTSSKEIPLVLNEACGFNLAE